MLKGKRLLAVVPARGGSKGVPLKNIHPLQRIPLLAHVGRLVQELAYFDKAVVSTDHSAIAQVALEWGLEVPFYRPESLSGDLIGDWDVLNHALLELERLDGLRYDVVVMLQPTSPLREPQHVTAVIHKLIDEGWDAVWTVSPTDLKYHPLKQLKLGGDGAMNHYLPEGRNIIARQQLDQTYTRNGVAYAFTRECILEQRTTLPLEGNRCSAVVIEEPMISIDTLEDFRRVEMLLAAREQKGSV